MKKLIGMMTVAAGAVGLCLSLGAEPGGTAVPRMSLRLRGVPANATLTWRALRRDPLPLAAARTGDVVRVTIPEIGAWNAGYIDVKQDK